MKRELGKMFGTFILIKTYAMEIYQFYHMTRQKNDGEYILLTEEETFRYKIPKNRAWYQNTDKKFLATDKLTKITNYNKPKLNIMTDRWKYQIKTGGLWGLTTATLLSLLI
jgi:hypothetical protein